MNKLHRRVRIFDAFLILVIVLISSIIVFGGIGITDKDKFSNWTILGPNGGDVRAVEIDPRNKDRVFITTLDGQIYVSNDAGATWQLLVNLNKPELNLDDLLIDSRDSNVIYASGHGLKDTGGFFKTTDGGASWKEAKELRNESIHSLTSESIPSGTGLRVVWASMARP